MAITTASSRTTSRPPGTTEARRRHARRRLASVAAALAGLTLLAAACSGDDGDDTVAGDTGSGSGASESGSGGGGDEMTISIAAPSGGATVEPGFQVQVEPSVDVGEPDTGLHHVHLYYDGNQSDGEYDIVYSADEPWTVERELDAGEHTIEAVIANPDHSLTDASDEVTVMVEDAGGGGGDTTDTSDQGGVYGY